MPEFDEKNNEKALAIVKKVERPKRNPSLEPELDIQNLLKNFEAKHKPIDNSKKIIGYLQDAGTKEPALGKLVQQYFGNTPEQVKNLENIGSAGRNALIEKFSQKVQASNDISPGHKRYVQASAKVAAIEAGSKRSYDSTLINVRFVLENYNNAKTPNEQNTAINNLGRINQQMQSIKAQTIEQKKLQYAIMKEPVSLPSNNINQSTQRESNTNRVNNSASYKSSMPKNINTQQNNKEAPQVNKISTNKEQLKEVGKLFKNIITAAVKQEAREIGNNLQKKLNEHKAGRLAVKGIEVAQAGVKGAIVGARAGYKAAQTSYNKNKTSGHSR